MTMPSVPPEMPPAMRQRPVDPATGLRVPFYADSDEGGSAGRGVVEARAVQCALDRLCGACGLPLGYPLAFVGGNDEHATRRFRRPAMHEDCAEHLVASAGLGERVLLTGSFQLDRPDREAEDRSVHFLAGAEV